MKRNLSILALAVAASSLAGCGSPEDNASAAGERIGKSIASLQTVVMTRPVHFELEGIESELESIKGDVPADSYAELTEAFEALSENAREAVNHSDALAEASIKGAEEFSSVTGSGQPIEAFKKGLRKGFDQAAN